MNRYILGFLLFSSCISVALAEPIRVLVWDEQQPEQKPGYKNFLGNAIADSLAQQPGLTVRSASLADPEQGLSKAALDQCDVLIWWGHKRHGEIKPETSKAIVERVKNGELSLISLHSAHWSGPFIEAMNARTRQDALKSLTDAERATLKIVEVPAKLYRQPRREEPLTPSFGRIKDADGADALQIVLPNCCFPAYRGDGLPSHVTALLPEHPIAKGVPAHFDIPQTEMYDEAFHVPAPDVVIFEERWDKGEHFRSGSLWQVGKGRVFYFRPGHETYPIFTQPEPLKIIGNAVRFLGDKSAR
ncbi:MAG: Trehalose utilization protein [Chthoniobacteraceae bacterium]|nr:Trehalose utilization protein [Chthoniobacteraceae bacterium]